MKRHRWMFSNRLMLINALVLMAVIYAVAYLASVSFSRLEVNRLLLQRREILAALSDSYDRKHDEFFTLIFSLYDDKGNYDVISAILENPSDDSLMDDPFLKQRVAVMMQWLTVRDGDIAAILLYKNASGMRYVYDARRQILDSAPASYPFFAQLREKPPGRVVYGARKLGLGSDTRQVYGIAGTIGTRQIRMDAGRIMVAYDTMAFRRILARSEGRGEGRYIIVTGGGEVVFDSGGELYGSPFPYADLLDAPSSDRPRVVGGHAYYVQAIRQPGRGTTSLLMVPREEVERPGANSSVTIFALCTVFALFSAGLYLLAGLLVSRRVSELERAMDRVGSNNLAYRIPLSGRDDEYEHISVRFNRMCDELQSNIDRLYVYQLNQKSAELAALQSRINPHFLYNTLEAVRATYADGRGEEAGEMIVLLADMFRGSARAEAIVTLRQELSSCRTYVDLMTRRFPDGLAAEIAVEEDILDLGVVTNLLQPVIENYFLHGYVEEREDNRVAIRGRADGDFVALSVEDNGRGMDAERQAEVRRRLQAAEPGGNPLSGLSNVGERMRIVFGDGCGLSLQSAPGAGTTVTLRIRAMTCDAIRRMMGRNNGDAREEG